MASTKTVATATHAAVALPTARWTTSARSPPSWLREQPGASAAEPANVCIVLQVETIYIQ